MSENEQIIVTINDDGTCSAGVWGEHGQSLVNRSDCWPQPTVIQRVVQGRVFEITICSALARPAKVSVNPSTD